MKRDALMKIISYSMTNKEAKAFKVACLYEQIAQQIFPGLRFNSLWVGDPRKKELFKYCWKFINDTAGRLDPRDYKFFIYAQLQVFKAYAKGDRPPLIHPNCLVGPKSWERWLGWKRKFEQRKKITTVVEAKIDVNSDDRVVKELTKTKQYFLQKFRRHEAKDILDALESRTLLRWITLKSVSGYYPYLSPIVSCWLENKKLSVVDYFGHALDVYNSGITPASREFFKREFGYEYVTNTPTPSE